MPGNPVKKRPQSDLANQIPSDWSPELQKAYDKALKDYKAQMPAGDILDYVRTPFNVMSNSMAGLGAEMLGKGKQFEAKYGWMPKTRAEMDAVEAMMGAMGPVIDTMDYLKVPPIVGPNTPTIAAAMQGVDQAAARLTAEQAAKAAKNAGQAVKKAATSDDMAYAIENLLRKTGHGPMEIMIGPNARTYRHDDAALAAQMEKEGKSRRDIWQATKTMRAPDNEFRQELSDMAMKYNSNTARDRQFEAAKQRFLQAESRATSLDELDDAEKYFESQVLNLYNNTSGKAQEFVKHPELFAAYPELSNYVFRQLEPTNSQFYAPETVNGYFSPGEQRITINSNDPNKRSTALHELQHAIQEIEGWQGGASPEQVAARMAERDIAKTREADLQKLIQEMQLTLPASQNNLILTERQKLKNIQDFLNKTKQLEGETDPYDAYRKVSGEEEARMVQERQNYPEEILTRRPPYMDYEADPSKHITDFATGGAVMMADGGMITIEEFLRKQGY